MTTTKPNPADIVAAAASAPAKRMPTATRLKALDALREKGYTWPEIAKWFEDQGYAGHTETALKTSYCRANKARRSTAGAEA